MELVNVENLKKLTPKSNDVSLPIWVDLLNAIECPSNFQSLQFVLHTLEISYSINPPLFCETFAVPKEFDSSFFDYFSNINFTDFPNYYRESLPVGSKSDRPIFAILFTFSSLLTPHFVKPLLLLLNHYYKNESLINRRDKSEDVFRALRLLYQDPLFKCDCLFGDDVNVIAQKLEDYKQQLAVFDGDSDQRILIKYVRDLIHFCRLDWSQPVRRKRKTKTTMRSSYNRTRVERIYGSEDLYTYKLKSLPSSIESKTEGIAESEDYPPLAFIKTKASEVPKPIFELPDKAAIKDVKKDRVQNSAIQRESKKSHNLILTSRTLLQCYEMGFLLDELLSRRKGKVNGLDKQFIRGIALLSLVTGRPIEQVAKLKCIDVDSIEVEGLYKNHGHWYLKSYHAATAENGPQRTNSNLLRTNTEVYIQFPTWISNVLDLLALNADEETGKGHKVDTLNKAIQQLITSLNRKQHCQISLKKINYHLVNYVVAYEQFDPVILECLTGKPSYYTRSPRHYAWYSNDMINRHIQTLYEDAFLVEADSALQDGLYSWPVRNEVGVGSQFTPKQDSLRTLVKHLQLQLGGSHTFDMAKRLSSAIDYHNAYTLYTLYMMLNATGYRAVGNPLPSFNLLLNRYSALCISDKDSVVTFAHMRVIACAPVLTEQLNHYLDHVRTMSRLLSVALPNSSEQYKDQASPTQFIDLKSKNEKLNWFITTKNSKGNDGLFVFFDHTEQGKIKATNAYPKSLKQHSEELPSFPMNFGRHYVRLYLQEKRVNQELVKFQLGHWVAGENPLELFSTFDFKEAVNTLCPILEQMMGELGWQAIPSALTRKRL
ncbi:MULTISPECIES: hypothetical protein [Vibrio]|uniref:Uncharacterized protein n=1 Tax=Vibrio halioticoli NBRC 102217 TaxID=1219072 RepID=V5HJT9_9VIBR|nr:MULTISPECIES: hypothetical protein [Vibrio]MPW36554.1 hypothetical protein [Vibrio sp. B1Z05]GAD89525.1 hypothetical protein VHA01S_021_00190 [Vibrio halioticoli NBRC 102217]